MSQFGLGARVTDAVPIVARALVQERQPSVLDEAADAARCLLYEAQQREERALFLKERFGTDDVSDILGNLTRKLTHEEAEALSGAARERPGTRFTSEHANDLRRALAELISNRASDLSPSTLKKAQEALRDYSAPQEK